VKAASAMASVASFALSVRTLSAMGTVTYASTATPQTAMVVVLLIRLLHHRALRGAPVTNAMCPINLITTHLTLPK